MRHSQLTWVCGGLVMAAILAAGVMAADQPAQTPPSASGNAPASAAEPASPAASDSQEMPEHHIVLTPDQLKWGPCPGGLPAGGEMAVLDGDPSRPGLYTLRLKASGKYTIPPHWHSQAEHVTVLEGKLHIGAGDAIDKTKATALPPGGYASLPARMHHYAYSDEPTVIQIHGEGPFDIHYVNPADDPRHP